jgi:hypothetical protein
MGNSHFDLLVGLWVSHGICNRVDEVKQGAQVPALKGDNEASGYKVSCRPPWFRNGCRGSGRLGDELD